MSTEKLIKPETKEEDEKPSNVIPLRVITGGGGIDQYNWLKNLEVGTVFLTRHKPKPMERMVSCIQLEVLFQAEKATKLWEDLGKSFSWVVTQDFSAVMELVEVLAIVQQEQEEK